MYSTVSSENRPSTNSLGCGFDRGNVMRVPMIEMRAFEGKRRRLCLLPVICPEFRRATRRRGLEASRLSVRVPVFRFPSVCPWDGLLHRLIAPFAPNARKTALDSSRSHGLSSLLPTSPLMKDLFARRRRVSLPLLASPPPEHLVNRRSG